MEPIDVLRPTETELRDGITNYKNILNDSYQLNKLFSVGQWFSYAKENFLHASSHVHAYPAMLGGHLIFFLIPSAYDNADTPEIWNYVQMCPVTAGERSNRISSKTALVRIQRWKERHAEWIPEQVKSEYGMFQAFNIDHQDFEEDVVWISLGLKSNSAFPGSPDLADLIVENDLLNTMVYDDFSRPVPPYSATAAANSFYLLSL
jgi:hypothetical protein